MGHRLHPRVSVKPSVLAHCRLGSEACDFPVADLSADGCLIQVPACYAAEFRTLRRLEGWRLSCPDLPRTRLNARVVWVRGPGEAPDAPLEAGLSFTGLPDRYARRLDEYLTFLMKTGMPPIDFTGMPA
jgi:hypothetical protein